MMKKPFHDHRDTDGTDALTVADVLALSGLSTDATHALASGLAHPLGTAQATLVVQEELRGHDEEYALVRLVLATGCDAVCLLDGDDRDGSGPLFVVQANEDGAWIGYCRAFADTAAAQMALVPTDPAHDLHLVMDVDGRLERRDGRPATHPAFGHRIAASRLGRLAEGARGETTRANAA